jgi:hypothetical protein
MPTDQRDTTPPEDQHRFVEVPWEPPLPTTPEEKVRLLHRQLIEAYREVGNAKMADQLTKLLNAKGTRGARKKYSDIDKLSVFKMVQRRSKKNRKLTASAICEMMAEEPALKAQGLTASRARHLYREHCLENGLDPKTAHRIDESAAKPVGN